jgi:hypothetical protein
MAPVDIKKLDASANRITQQQADIAYCVEHEEQLTPWERNFIDSISVYSAGGGFLSSKQEAVLAKITGQLEDAETDRLGDA